MSSEFKVGYSSITVLRLGRCNGRDGRRGVRRKVGHHSMYTSVKECGQLESRNVRMTSSIESRGESEVGKAGRVSWRRNKISNFCLGYCTIAAYRSLPWS